MSAERPRARVALSATLALALGLCAPASAHAAGPAERHGLNGVLRGVPRLVRVDPDEATRVWGTVKGLGSPAAQVRALRDRGLDALACTGLVDMRAVVRDQGAPFTFRDNVRGRSWARPILAHTLVEALRRFEREFPGRTLAIGDVAQPGCGQLSYGALVRHLVGDEAVELLNGARLVLGRPTRTTLQRAEPDDEDGPFARGAPVELERVIVGHERTAAGELLLRVVERRFRAIDPPAPAALDELSRELRRLARPSHAVDAQRTITVGPDGRPADRWVTHYVDTARGEQLIAVTDSAVGARLDLARVVELRFSPWTPGKPGSYRDEVRWRRIAFPGAGARWQRWRQRHEAGHVSHVGGLDVDLSYVTLGNGSHFAIDVEAMDVRATWRWFEILVETSRDLGTPVELILIDPKIKRHLVKHLPERSRRSPLWNTIVRLSDGHDGHHHIRLAHPKARADEDALRALAPKSGGRSGPPRSSPAAR